MHDHICPVDQFGEDRRIADGVDGIRKAVMLDQVADVLDASRRKVIDYADFVASKKIRLGKVGADETCPSSDQKTQPVPSETPGVQTESVGF
jgi:hypothetical protein